MSKESFPVRYMVVKRWYGYAVWDTYAHDGWWTVGRFFSFNKAQSLAWTLNTKEGFRNGP